MFPDVNHTTISGHWARNVIKDDKWLEEVFIPAVQQRGAAIINARGKSSAASAGDAAIKHMRDWIHGAADWQSMAIYSDGDYGVAAGIFSSFPVQCYGAGEFGVIDKLPIDSASAAYINASVNELVQEKQAIESLLPNPVYRLVPIDKDFIFKPEFVLGKQSI